MKMLEKCQENRHQSMREVSDVLSQFLHTDSPASPEQANHAKDHPLGNVIKMRAGDWKRETSS